MLVSRRSGGGGGCSELASMRFFLGFPNKRIGGNALHLGVALEALRYFAAAENEGSGPGAGPGSGPGTKEIEGLASV